MFEPSQELKSYLEEKRRIINETLERLLNFKIEYGERVLQAAKYSLLDGGKRIRPILCLMGYELFGRPGEDILIFACGLECLHTYSLIHDDLPAMDDDDFRRGKPSCHKAFDEATAILAGDGLLTFAFECFSHPALLNKVNPLFLLKAIHHVAKASGFEGMVGGQMADLLAENQEGTEELLRWIHEHKTVALIEASLVSGALLAEAKEEEINQLSLFGQKLGLLFQITDDLLDILGDEALLGKPVKSDLKKKKLTYPALFGIEKTKEIAEKTAKEAIALLLPFGKRASLLEELTYYILHRSN